MDEVRNRTNYSCVVQTRIQLAKPDKLADNSTAESNYIPRYTHVTLRNFRTVPCRGAWPHALNAILNLPRWI